MFFIAIPVSDAPGASGWFTKYAVVRVFYEGERVVTQEDLPLKNCSFSWGWGERLYVLYLPGLQTPKYRVV